MKTTDTLINSKYHKINENKYEINENKYEINENKNEITIYNIDDFLLKNEIKRDVYIKNRIYIHKFDKSYDFTDYFINKIKQHNKNNIISMCNDDNYIVYILYKYQEHHNNLFDVRMALLFNRNIDNIDHLI